jgi:hypothetical protein
MGLKHLPLINIVLFFLLLSFWELDKTNNFLMSLFFTIITKEIFRRNVALISFVGSIAIIVTRR